MLALALPAMGAQRYANLNSASPASPYTTWATAATNIQDAVNAAVAGDLILVTNGVYETGATAVYNMSNRVAVTKALTVRSVNGPEVTIIAGYQVPGTANGPTAVRCVYLTEGAVLSGFTLTNGATKNSGDGITEQSGGGVWCESTNAVVTNCVLAGNLAAWYGGGACGGTLNNCTLAGNSAGLSGGGASAGKLNSCALIGNSAFDSGGGAFGATLDNCSLAGNLAARSGGGCYSGRLNNCTVTGNQAFSSGGIHSGTLYNCIVYYNSAPYNPNHSFSTFYRSCTEPLPGMGMQNITNTPLFVDTNGWANLRLQSNSPCINAGYNSYTPWPLDLDGLPRISGGKVDMGAYEYQGMAFYVFHSWLAQYGLPTDGSADYADSDNDHLNNWQEWMCLTVPTNRLSVLRLFRPSLTGSNVNLIWQSVAGVRYFLERSTNLVAAPAFEPLATNLLGLPEITGFTDTNTVSFPRFYRVGVQP